MNVLFFEGAFNLSAIGFVSGGIQAEGRNDVILNVPSGTGTIDLRFFYIDAAAGRSFYIDDIVIKKLDETATTFISQYLNENYTTSSDWVQTNTNITYSTGTLKIARAVAGTGFYSAAKSVNLIQDQLYKVTFDVTNLSQMSPSQPAGSNKLFFGHENEDGTSWIDYTAPVANTATGTYTYYVVPKTNRGNLYFTVANDGGGSFECEIDNFKVEHVLAPFKPMYTATLSTVTDYYAFGSPMPGRQFNSPNYRYGFNGKENDQEETGWQDYGMREYDTRLGRFFAVDPLVKSYPMLTPYQFASNSPISGIDRDGLEYYYAADGTFLGKIGTSTQVMKVDAKNVAAVSFWINAANNPPKGASAGYVDRATGYANSYSTDAGMTNAELNTRAFLSTIKQAENKGNTPLEYNSANGIVDGKVRTFTDNSYEEAPQDYASHPGDANGTGSSAAGAYQILKGPFEGYQSQNPDEITDFSPQSQDRIAIK